jgi:4-alpha-glucanotransferase
VLLHPTSLPGGRLGDAAFRFVDWLHAAGQRWWQVLPLGPPGDHGSPYSSPSAFAGSPALLARPHARVTADEIEEFVAANAYWIADWAAYARPSEGPIADQVRFTREWRTLRQHAADRGIRILGDVPFYVALGGADQRGRPELFQEGEVAGVPPDDWSATGQLWGNPVYDWRAMRDDGFRWWTERVRVTLQHVDAVRIDHFRGFVAYWAVPARARTARNGRWRRAPGADLFARLHADLGELPVVAEDLGIITPAVRRLRRQFGMPGCVVMQFLFTENMQNPQRPSDDDDVVVYTGTHDNDTTVGWWTGLGDRGRRGVDRALAAAGIEEARPHWKLIRLALASRGRIAITPAQDLLGLGSAARMNRPGRARGNWRWRLEPGQLDRDLAAELRDRTAGTDRLTVTEGRKRA